jgi:mannose-6-phosphate isomerase-like protein (cupin superfamily)
MNIMIIETHNLKTTLPTSVFTTQLLETQQVRTLFLNLSSEQKVPPCQMSATVLYFVVEGQGSLHVKNEQAELQTGSLAVVPAGNTRSISATTPMRILAVQLL